MPYLAHLDGTPATKESVVKLLVENKASINHIKNKAGARGLNLHDALETWAETGLRPHPPAYPPEQRGYVEGFLAFTESCQYESTDSEVLVGSIEQQFAGRYDQRGNYCGPVHFGKQERTIDAPCLLDLKTSKAIYGTQFLQLEGYEGASIECGYEPTTHRLVVRIDAEGGYEVRASIADYEDFLAIRRAYAALKRVGV